MDLVYRLLAPERPRWRARDMHAAKLSLQENAVRSDCRARVGSTPSLSPLTDVDVEVLARDGVGHDGPLEARELQHQTGVLQRERGGSHFSRFRCAVLRLVLCEEVHAVHRHDEQPGAHEEGTALRRVRRVD